MKKNYFGMLKGIHKGFAISTLFSMVLIIGITALLLTHIQTVNKVVELEAANKDWAKTSEALKQDIVGLEVDKEALQGEIDVLTSDREAKTTVLTSQEEVLAEQKEIVASQEATIKAKDEELKKITDLQGKTAKHVTELEKELDEITTTFKLYQEELGSIKTNFEVYKNELVKDEPSAD